MTSPAWADRSEGSTNIKYGKIRCFGILRLRQAFFIFYGIPEAREVSKNLPGARGFVFPKYEPVASHGDPKRVPNYAFYVNSEMGTSEMGTSEMGTSEMEICSSKMNFW